MLFWNHKVRVYSNFASLFSFVKDNFSVFFRSNLKYFRQKELIEVKFSDFWMVEWKSPNSSCHIWNHKFFFKLCVTIQCHERSLFCIFLAKTLYDLDIKSPSKCKLLTTQVKFHQFYTLIGSFRWKYIKFQVIRCRGLTSHDNEDWCKI